MSVQMIKLADDITTCEPWLSVHQRSYDLSKCSNVYEYDYTVDRPTFLISMDLGVTTDRYHCVQFWGICESAAFSQLWAFTFGLGIDLDDDLSGPLRYHDGWLYWHLHFRTLLG